MRDDAGEAEGWRSGRPGCSRGGRHCPGRHPWGTTASSRISSVQSPRGASSSERRTAAGPDAASTQARASPNRTHHQPRISTSTSRDNPQRRDRTSEPQRESRSPGRWLMSKARTTRAGNGLTPGKASRPIDTMAERGNHPRPGRVGRRRRDVRTPWSPGLRVVRGGVRARRDRGRLQASRPSSHSTITTPRWPVAGEGYAGLTICFAHLPDIGNFEWLGIEVPRVGAPGIVPGSVARITD